MYVGFEGGCAPIPTALASASARRQPLLVLPATLPVGPCPAGHGGGERQLSEGGKEGRETKTGKRDLNKRKNDARRGRKQGLVALPLTDGRQADHCPPLCQDGFCAIPLKRHVGGVADNAVIFCI